ncbi:hypothetical protein L9W84_17005 [Vibrio aestuarianus]|nr:hypothetical protein [Vibrio vulnificus]MCG6451301.1 hypothetical protein [Vibrio parahaemolyticus]MDE1215293.1 hypothetical protein [Vibrio aestuarianus]MCG8706666.1 hypothetical protein [Vibrio vulnificus]MCG9655618.1 hypothetical protein [Vibrio vulnificus]
MIFVVKVVCGNLV